MLPIRYDLIPCSDDEFEEEIESNLAGFYWGWPVLVSPSGRLFPEPAPELDLEMHLDADPPFYLSLHLCP